MVPIISRFMSVFSCTKPRLACCCRSLAAIRHRWPANGSVSLSDEQIVDIGMTPGAGSSGAG
jgi:hypothetical protein